MTTTYTVDVSHHDWSRAGGRLDWARAARSGIAAVCVRATYGDPDGLHWPTPHARDMLRGARAAELITGGYHNLVRGDTSSIRRQVDWLRRELDATSAVWGMVDVERYEELLSRDMHPRIGDVRAWCDRWRQVEDRQMLVYLPRWVWQHMGSPDLRGLGYPLVASDYGGNSAGAAGALYAGRGGNSGRGWSAYGGMTPALWQYGSEARVPGLSSKTDINAFRGTPQALRALLTGQQEDDMPSAQDVARAVLGARYREYADQDGDGVRDSRTVVDIVYATHAAAVRTERYAQEQVALLRAQLGQPAEQITAEIRAQSEATRAALVAAVTEQAPALAAAVAERLGGEVTATEIGEALAVELAGMLAAGAPAGADTTGIAS